MADAPRQTNPKTNQALSSSPEVSIGVPVLNGAQGLAAALDTLIGQTVKDIEIIISDNASSDATPHICLEYQRRDPRIRYYRQDRVLAPADNFMFVFGKARAPYYMWAADDDLRAPDFIERLRDALVMHRTAVLAFGDVVDVSPTGVLVPELQLPKPGASRLRKLGIVAFNTLHPIYGLWRTEKLRKLVWIDNDWFPDLPFMMSATMLGDFVRIDGAEFRYRRQGNRRYFALPRQSSGAGRWRNALIRFRRASHMIRAPFIAAFTVGRIAGPGLGLGAFAFIAAKAGYLATGYFWHWLRVQAGMLPKPPA